jgi:hypothetical protein
VRKGTATKKVTVGSLDGDVRAVGCWLLILGSITLDVAKGDIAISKRCPTPRRVSELASGIKMEPRGGVRGDVVSTRDAVVVFAGKFLGEALLRDNSSNFFCFASFAALANRLCLPSVSHICVSIRERNNYTL